MTGTQFIKFDAIIQQIQGSHTRSGGARFYLNDVLISTVEGSLVNLLIPLNAVDAGQHVLRVELSNYRRDYTPVIRSAEVVSVSGSVDEESLLQAYAESNK